MDEPVVLQKAYDLAVWYAQRTERFPKAYRYTLADRIQEALFRLMRTLRDAAYARQRDRALEQAQ